MMILPLYLQTPTTLSLDLSKPGVQVSPMLYGLMTEEINYSYDGGLYAELIRNRAFQDNAKNPEHWKAVDGGSIRLTDQGPTPARRMALEVSGGVSNDGFWGVPVFAGTTYRLSVYAKAQPAGNLTATLESEDGRTVYAKARLNAIGTGWTKVNAVMKTAKDVVPTTAGRLVLRTGKDQTVSLTQVSLFPPTHKNRPNGNRPDLMEKLIAMKPRFLRFPGGNYLEGNTLRDRFPWKDTLGPIENRRGHWAPWGYRSSDGMGLLEFLLWTEDMGAKPLLGVYAGYNLNGTFIPAGPALQPYVQEALDEIEYVIGDVNTRWGRQRALDGHPKPFPLEYVEVGNEDGFDRSGSYEDRFVQFYDAIRAKYPKLKIISTTGGQDGLGRPFPIKKRRPDLWDEHYYAHAWDLMGMATHYDNYDRKGPKVFVGEFAAHDGPNPWENVGQNGPTPDMYCGVADAAYMTGLERNSDIVEMATYAPLLVNVNPGGRQWSVNMIGYDNMKSFGSPSYYAQTIFAQNIGTQTVPLTLSGTPQQKNGNRTLPGIFASATRDKKKGELYLKVVNAMDSAQDVQIDLKGAKVGTDGTITVITGEPKAVNTLAEPEKIVPKTSKLKLNGSTLSYKFAPYSVNVIKLGVR